MDLCDLAEAIVRPGLQEYNIKKRKWWQDGGSFRALHVLGVGVFSFSFASRGWPRTHAQGSYTRYALRNGAPPQGEEKFLQDLLLTGSGGTVMKDSAA